MSALIAQEEWEKLKRLYPGPLRFWTFSISDRSLTAAGYCSPKYKVIRVARWLVDSGRTKDILDTVRHEVAHALVWHYERDEDESGHGEVWQRWAKSLGASTDRTYSEELFEVALAANPYRYEVVCLECGESFFRHRKFKKRRIHNGCGGDVEYRPI